MYSKPDVCPEVTISIGSADQDKLNEIVPFLHNLEGKDGVFGAELPENDPYFPGKKSVVVTAEDGWLVKVGGELSVTLLTPYKDKFSFTMEDSSKKNYPEKFAEAHRAAHVLSFLGEMWEMQEQGQTQPVSRLVERKHGLGGRLGALAFPGRGTKTRLGH
jgi:hypothetical protein